MSKEQTIEIDAEVTEAIVKSTTEAMEVKLKEATDKFEAELKGLKEEGAAVEGEVIDKGARGAANTEEQDFDKHEHAAEQLKALMRGDKQKLADLNVKSYETQFKAGKIDKATYQNATTDADGGYLVPSSELLDDVMSVLPEYSAFVGELRTITLTSGDTLDVSTLVGDVTVTEVGSEGGTKDDSKVTFGQTSITVREFAAIVGFTKQWVRQSSMDVYAVIRNSMARGIAKKREQIALVDATSGITEIAGTVETYMGGSSTSGSTSVANATWTEIKAMPYAVPTQSANGGIYVISRVLLAALDGLTDNQGRDIVIMDQGGAGALSGRFKNGYRFVVAESLGTADAVDTAFAVFGNFGQYGVLLRQGAVENDLFDSGSYNDGTTDHNLISQNKMAWRTAFYENVGYPVAGAFNVLKTAAS